MEEDEYYKALEHIIARDFFPDNLVIEKDQEAGFLKVNLDEF